MLVGLNSKKNLAPKIKVGRYKFKKKNLAPKIGRLGNS